MISLEDCSVAASAGWGLIVGVAIWLGLLPMCGDKAMAILEENGRVLLAEYSEPCSCSVEAKERGRGGLSE